MSLLESISKNIYSLDSSSIEKQSRDWIGLYIQLEA